MIYNDCEIRAWQVSDTQVQVLVHSSPAGEMQQPLAVAVDPDILASIHKQTDAFSYAQFQDSSDVIEIGRQLARILLPCPIYLRLVSSQERIGPNQGLRLRLCLDEQLMDYPWEWLYRPDRLDDALDGFLVLDPQISLVRGAPMRPLRDVQTSAASERLLFVGTFWRTKETDDHWGVKREYDQLLEYLEPVGNCLAPEFISADDDHIEQALAAPTQIFHYVGHAGTVDGRSYIVKRVVDDAIESQLYCETLGILLQRAKVRIAVLMACNSGLWQVARPLLQRGLPVLVGGCLTCVPPTAI